MAKYVEPGVFTNVVDRVANADVNEPKMLPCMIGKAIDKLSAYVAMTRSTGEYDVLPDGVTIDTITMIGFYPYRSYFLPGEAPNDYLIRTESVEENVPGADGETTVTRQETRIYWTETGAAKIVEGSTYYITYNQPVNLSEHGSFTINYSDMSNIPSILGEYVVMNSEGQTTINSLALCTLLAFLNGAPAVEVVPLTDSTPAAYNEGLSKVCVFDRAIWRMVPTDMPYTDSSLDFKQIHLAIDNHVRAYSSYEERMERTAIYGYKSADENAALETYKNYAQSKNYYRITHIFPDTCAIDVPDYGIVSNLGPQYVAAAYAGLEASMNGWEPKTRMTLRGIYSIGGKKLTRAEMNDLAEAGILILTQPDGPGTDVVIRHQLTTDTVNVKAGLNENSVVYVRDYISKRMRAVCEPYVGRNVINSDLTTRIKASLDAEIASLVNEGAILGGTVEEIIQDEDNLDTILVSLTVFVPRPCNKIKINIIAE